MTMMQWAGGTIYGDGGLTDPSTVDNLSLWIDASDGTTVTKDGSNRVSQIDDKVGSYNWTQAGGNALKPIHGTRTINGLDVLDFDGVNQFMNGAAMNAFIDSDGIGAWFCVLEVDSADPVAQPWVNVGVISDNTSNFTLLHAQDNNGTLELEHYSFEGGTNRVDVAAVYSQTHIFTGRYDGTDKR